MQSEPRKFPCPSCGVRLVAEQHAAIKSHLCPRGHGLLLEDADLRNVVRAATVTRLRGLYEEGAAESHACPVCLQALHQIEVQGVAAHGCVICGSLWVATEAIEHHVRDVRRREFGPASFAARDDVNSRTNLQPTEVVAGLLAYYEMEPTGAPSSA